MDCQILSQYIESDCVGERFDKILTKLFPDISRAELQRCIKSGAVSLDGELITNPSKKLCKSGVVKIIYANTKLRTYDFSPENIPIEVLYEDEHIIIVNKQAGLVCHPAPGHKSGTLVNALAGRWQLSDIGERPGVVHRLDKDTSGIMIVAKTNIAHAKFTELFATGKGTQIRRFYICFVFNVPAEKEGKIDTFMCRHPKNRQMFTVSQNKGKHAITLYKTIKTRYYTSTKAISKIECELLTGRTHQIRVHMHHIGCPLIGDQVYKKRHIEEVYPDLIKSFSRQALHSHKLFFVNPFTKEEMNFILPMPTDMQALDRELI